MGRFRANKANKVIIIIEAETNKFVINTYPKMNNPMRRRRFFYNIANNGAFIKNFCNNPYKKFHRFYHEWYLYNLLNNNTIVCES